jgi:hypothetical protein
MAASTVSATFRRDGADYGYRGTPHSYSVTAETFGPSDDFPDLLALSGDPDLPLFAGAQVTIGGTVYDILWARQNFARGLREAVAIPAGA